MNSLEELLQARVTRRIDQEANKFGTHGHVEFLLPTGKIAHMRPAHPFEIRLWEGLVRQHALAEQVPDLLERVELLESQNRALRSNLERMRRDHQ